MVLQRTLRKAGRGLGSALPPSLTVPSPFVPGPIQRSRAAVAVTRGTSPVSCFPSWCLVTALARFPFSPYCGGTDWASSKSKQRAGAGPWGGQRPEGSSVCWGPRMALLQAGAASQHGARRLSPARLLVLINVCKSSGLLPLHQIQRVFNVSPPGSQGK